VRAGSTLSLTKSPGGLVTALEPALRDHGGVWIGWSGLDREAIAAAGGLDVPGDPRVSYIDIPISTHEASAYYHGFSNRTLWPLLHYFIDRTEIDAATWRAYERVNDRFAAVTADAVRGREALVWVHDYQLMRVPQALRRLVPDIELGFFLHVPFPAVDVFRVLPWSRELLRGMLGADHVGFHTAAYAAHFIDSAEQLLGCAVDRGASTVRFDGRVVGVGVHPASIDVAEADRLAAQAGDTRATDGTRHIIGVDRLDYTKGIVPRLEAVGEEVV
jgi:trehalose 6-phosphate synthase/phosphatase